MMHQPLPTGRRLSREEHARKNEIHIHGVKDQTAGRVKTMKFEPMPHELYLNRK